MDERRRLGALLVTLVVIAGFFAWATSGFTLSNSDGGDASSSSAQPANVRARALCDEYTRDFGPMGSALPTTVGEVRSARAGGPSPSITSLPPSPSGNELAAWCWVKTGRGMYSAWGVLPDGKTRLVLWGIPSAVPPTGRPAPP